MRGRRRPLRPIICPQDGRYLAQSDGQRLYFGLPQPTVLTRSRVTLCCPGPNCAGHVTWHPGPAGPEPEPEPGPEPDAS